MGANTGATYIHTDMNFLRSLAENDFSKMFPVFARVRIQARHAFAQTLISQAFFLRALVLCRGVLVLCLRVDGSLPFAKQQGPPNQDLGFWAQGRGRARGRGKRAPFVVTSFV